MYDRVGLYRGKKSLCCVNNSKRHLTKRFMASNAITKLVQDSPKAVTAVVYIDGSVVTNATVAANAQYSMTGKLNLQFSSDATLMPAQNSALRDGK